MAAHVHAGFGFNHGSTHRLKATKDPMGRKKIAILGGGMAGLSAAYELSRTPELRAQYDVTVHQMGWRVGGKAASGRDRWDRNIEHGLHVWFGCYHNVFAMTREVYAAWNKPPQCPLQSVEDVAKPQVYTPLGVNYQGQWTYFPVHWPTNEGVPGEGDLLLTPQEAFTTLYNLIVIAIKSIFDDLGHPAAQGLVAAPPLSAHFVAATSTSASLAAPQAGHAQVLFAQSQSLGLTFHSRLDATLLWMKALEGHPLARDPAHIDALADLHQSNETGFQSLAAGAAPTSALEWMIMGQLLNIGGAMARGFLRDVVLADQPFEALDALDFRAWLLKHGADPDVVATSSIVHGLYDTMFQYVDGDVDRPSYAAGTALGVVTRLVGTFKGSVMWNIQAGMGEAVVAPLYEVLSDRGVKFAFFHKVDQLEVSGQAISRIRFEVQARARDGDYRPTYLHPTRHIKCWPVQPDWDQLVDGEKLKASGVNFESHWSVQSNPQYETLEVEKDFDGVVLAIAMGAYKPLNAEPSMCADLIAANPRFGDFVNRMPLVPSQSVQLWSGLTAGELGWTTGPAAMVSGPQYLNIWDEMTQVLRLEDSPDHPKSLFYLTGTLNTQLYKEPSTQTDTPAVALAAMRADTIQWLQQDSAIMWPNATAGGKFRYEVLSDPEDGSGVERLDAQYLRVNIDPTECCVATIADSTQYRLLPDESGFANLFLAGEATRHGFNTTTIEGAVMSGMAAARAISGQPVTIVGYDFLRTPPFAPVS